MSAKNTAPVLSVKNLSVNFTTNLGVVEAVKNISVVVCPGETVAIVGESGSGKSQTMMATMGLLADNGIATGEVRFDDRNLLDLSIVELNQIRGSKITMIFQEPMTSLDPLYTVGRQLIEPIMRHNTNNQRSAKKLALELLDLVQIPEPQQRIKSYPYELSGGQRQRVMIAMALANNPDLLIADEPTTALDVTTQAKILELLADLQKQFGMAVVFITHDLGIVKKISNRVYVMKEGRVVEEGDTQRIFENPSHTYTKMLLNAEPEGTSTLQNTSDVKILSGEKVTVEFKQKKSWLAPVKILRAVDNVTMNLNLGQTLGVVGESGSGKSTLARALLRLLPSTGTIQFEGETLNSKTNAEMRNLRREMQLVFQDPFGSLSPRLTVGEIVTEGLLTHDTNLNARERDALACKVFTEVALDPQLRNRYPHEFSGGQRQRIAIARALVLNPKLIVLDEPTSALDRTIQKQIIELLRNLQQTHKLTYLFISHDLAVIRAMSDEVLVMKDGKIIEQGSTNQVFENPQQSYTQELIQAANVH